MKSITQLPDSFVEPLSNATGETLERIKPYYERARVLLYMSQDAKRFVARIICLSDESDTEAHRYHTEASYHRCISTIPGATVDRENPWIISLPTTDTSALILHHAIGQENIIFKHSLTVENESESLLQYSYLLKRFHSQNKRAEIVARYLTLGETPDNPTKGWVERDDLKLADYQRMAVIAGLGQEAQALFMDRGTGKTATAIQRMCTEARLSKKMIRVLIVCPPQVRWNWANEIRRFASVSGKTQEIRGGQIERIQSLVRAIAVEPELAFSASIISFDSLVPSADAFAKVPWDMVIVDESHFFKDARTNRFAAMMKIRENSKMRVILTGTPIGNTPFDLWTQLEFLGHGLSGFDDFKTFREFYGNWSTQNLPDGVERLAGLKNMPLFQERLSRLSVQITKEQAGLKLPEKVYDVVEVAMTKAQRTLYSNLATQFAHEIEDMLNVEGRSKAVTINNVLTKLLRLSQVTSGFSKTDNIFDEDGELLEEGTIFATDKKNPKIEALVELIKENDDPNSKTIVWAHWVYDIENIVEALNSAGIKAGAYYGKTPQDEREKLVHAYNNDDSFKVLVANAQTAAEGLNLLGYNPEKPEANDTYTGHEIFFSQGWSSILRGQAEDRAHRRGTRMPVRITDLVVPGTIDEEIRERVQAKIQMADHTIDVRHILKKLLAA